MIFAYADLLVNTKKKNTEKQTGRNYFILGELNVFDCDCVRRIIPERSTER